MSADESHPPQAEPSDPAQIAERYPLIATVTKFLWRQDDETLDEIQRALAREMTDAGPEAVASLCSRLADSGTDWHYYPRDTLAKRIHEIIADRVLASDSTLIGAEHAAQVEGKPVAIFANHLSYSDANLLQILLQRGGATSLSERLTVIAGPKVYSNLKRRFSSLCFGTIKTAQSSSLSSEDAVMSSREVARAARRTIEIAGERLALGEALLVFAEGTRSRTATLQQTLTGVARYLDFPGAWILPIGITGTEQLFPIAEETLNPVRVVIKVGRPLPAAAIRDRVEGDRRLLMDVVGLMIAAELPADYRGVYADDVEGLEQAKRILDEARQG